MPISSVVAALLIQTAVPADYRAKFPLPGLEVPSGWGINVGLRGAPEADFDKLVSLGAKWVRFDLVWSRIEKFAGVYDFEEYDQIMASLKKRGIRAILILDYGNKVHDVDSPRTREGRAAFARYATEAVKRYRGQGVLWEIWNEPNLKHFWRSEPSADEYVALVRVTADAIRTVSSQEWIIGPSISRFDWRYLERCFEEGMLQFLDAVSIHPYRDTRPPESSLGEWARLREMVDRFAPPGKQLPLICSEWGYATWGKGIKEEKQAEYIVRAYLSNLSAGVPITIWFSLRDRGVDPANKEHHFGIMGPALQPKPAFKAIQATLKSLNGFEFDSRVDLGHEMDHGLIFRKGDLRRLLLWTSNPKGSIVELPVGIGGFADERGRQPRTMKLRHEITSLEARY